jgi:LmbE family N-acetylglucosaminyl deacetylase
MAPPTLLAVHAHPDDEALFTGGVLARYAAQGVTTVLVTCTDGALGEAPGTPGPLEAGHRPGEVAARRRAELEASCAVLGIGHLEVLGYHDSGMAGWPQNDAPDAFCRAPVDAVAARVAELLWRYRPQVVVTDDARGLYGHPDHIQAHRVTMAAVAAAGVADKVYFPAIPSSALLGVDEVLAAHGLELPPELAGGDFTTADELVTTYVDCSAWAGTKYRSLAAHASQSDNAFFLDLGPELFGQFLGIEAFVRAFDRTGAPVPEDDLFAGVEGH